MGSLTQEMTRLRDEIDSLHSARKVFILDLKEKVDQDRSLATSMVKSFRNLHTDSARADKEVRLSFVSNLKSDVGDMLKGFEEDKTKVATETSKALLECVSTIKRFIIDLKADAEEMLRGFDDDRSGMATETRKRLKNFISDLKTEVDNMLTGFFASRTEMARNDEQSREDFISDLMHRVSEFRNETQKLLQVFQDDSHGARKAWTGVYPVKPAVRKKPPEARTREAAGPGAEDKKKEEKIKEPQVQEMPSTSVAKEPEIKVEKKRAEVNIPDDLTQIKGIGPGRQRKLNEAGIYTFAQLTEIPPENLRDALGEMGKLVPVEEWIEGAGRLVRKSE